MCAHSQVHDGLPGVWVCELKTLEQVAYHLSCFEDLEWFKLLKVLQGPDPAPIETTGDFGDLQGTRI